MSEGDDNMKLSFIVQELGRSHNRKYKAHPFDFSYDFFLNKLTSVSVMWKRIAYILKSIRPWHWTTGQNLAEGTNSPLSRKGFVERALYTPTTWGGSISSISSSIWAQYIDELVLHMMRERGPYSWGSSSLEDRMISQVTNLWGLFEEDSHQNIPKKRHPKLISKPSLSRNIWRYFD